jgi:GIY-YIG catalytic domain-containing protein
MTEVVEEGLKALLEPLPFGAARSKCPTMPGLYAFYGDKNCWSSLGLEGYDGRALYVGKSESDLVTRDLDGHFFAKPAWDGKKTSPTGHSTLRRSVAALLDFRAIHRNPNKPDHRYAVNFGLVPDDDLRLGQWMQACLLLAVWVPTTSVDLRVVENNIKGLWLPPLNLDVDTPWKTFVKGERAKLTQQVRRNMPNARDLES